MDTFKVSDTSLQKRNHLKLSVIIVNYNVKYFLEQALQSVRKASKGLSMEVFVVDNVSVDGSVEMVREKFPEVMLIANDKNVGFSIANNQAIRVSKGEYVLLLNPDTVVEEDTFSKCIDFMDSHPDAGALGCKMIDGSGKFLPESKRGFPSPWVAFYKTFGLSSIFPKSKKFNHYHLGYLDNEETHEIEILAGAFMFMRKTTLDKVGLLDEAFFMYGEDIDLSYRITEGGFKNYYFPETKIIHYKGESTKRGSLNYVKVFYNAMIIFAKKHFKGKEARFFILMMQLAIYLRASITVFSNFFEKAYLPILDALFIFIGLFFLKDFWATSYFDNPDYYTSTFAQFNMPLYISIWLTTIYFSGGYDSKYNLHRILRGVIIGTIVLAAVYGFLDAPYRTSRMLIILGAVWTAISMVGMRLALHFLEFRNFNISQSKGHNYIIVGSQPESERVQSLMYQAQVWNNFIGTVSAAKNESEQVFIGNEEGLAEIVNIYKVGEIIFCAKDLSNQSIMDWMVKLGSTIDYKIIAPNSNSIIGSSSKNSQGNLYTIDVQYGIASSMSRRNKRVFDVLIALVLTILLPVSLVLIKKPIQFIKNLFNVWIGKKSWIGYATNNNSGQNLPKIKTGILSPLTPFTNKKYNSSTIDRVNFFYAKDYSVYDDLELIQKLFRGLGSK